MRRLALLGLITLLPACQTVGEYTITPDEMFGNPVSGFPGFIGDTLTTGLNPNRPIGDSTNMKRVKGIDAAVDPLLPEPGNVWPGPPKPDPTLADIQREQNQDLQRGNPAPPARGSSTPVTPVQPVTPRAASPQASAPAAVMPAQPRPLQPGVVATPQGAAVISNGANGIQTYTLPNGITGRAIPNGNGTVTLIGPDGSVQSVPAPR
jgi:hypothetical protein